MSGLGQDITLDQLDVLLGIVEHGSFSAAARALRRTQGGVSYHVQRLEEQLDLELFDRSSRVPQLTEAGVVIVRQAQRLRDDMRKLRQAAAGLHQGLEPRLHLAIDMLFPPAPLASMLNDFRDAFPTVDVQIETGIVMEPADRVRDGRADVGVVLVTAAEDLDLRPCVSVEFDLVVAPFHPLAVLDRPVTVEDLRRYPNLVLPTGEASSTMVRSTAPSLRQWRVGDAFMRLELVRRGAGWARMPRHQVESDLQAGTLVRPDVSAIARAAPVLTLAVALHPDRPPGPGGRWWVDRLVALSTQSTRSARRADSLG